MQNVVQKAVTGVQATQVPKEGLDRGRTAPDPGYENAGRLALQTSGQRARRLPSLLGLGAVVSLPWSQDVRLKAGTFRWGSPTEYSVY